MIKLFPDQDDLADAIRASMAKFNKTLAVAPTGFGKTILFSYITSRARERGKRIGIFAHRAELTAQISEALRRFRVPHGMIGPGGGVPDLRHSVFVCSAQTYARRIHQMPEFDLGIIDECFPAGTIVDGRPIDSIQSGDYVDCFNHRSGKVVNSRVVRTFKSRPSSMVRLTIGGRVLHSTAGHPFYVEGVGYVEAINLVAGVHMVPVRNSISEQEPAAKVLGTREGVLLKVVQHGVLSENIVRDDGTDKSEVRVSQDDREEPDAPCGGSAAGKRYATEDRAQAEGTRRQRPWHDGSSVNPAGSSALGRDDGLYFGVHPADGHAVLLPDSLQNRHCGQVVDDGGGDRRVFSCGAGEARSGQKEGFISHLARVESIEVVEQTSDGTFGGVCPDGFVYNIEVEGHHNYFAEGFLVHNCHHATSGSTWGQCITRSPNAKWLGVTATPERLDGRGLRETFENMVMGPTTAELISMGRLSRYRLFAPGGMDTSGVHTLGGDFNRGELADAADKPAITGNAIEHYRKYLDGAPTVAFCVGIAHAAHVAESFRDAGYTAASIDGKMHPDDRARIVRDFKSGAISVLTSSDLVSEGFDLPGMMGAILLRPTKSLSLYLQQVGRALRTAPGKDAAVILDHAGNSDADRHGLPCQDREWSLDGRAGGKQKGEVSTYRECGVCFARVPMTRPECPECKTVFPIRVREIEEVAGQLGEVDVDARREEAKKQVSPERLAQQKTRTRDGLIELFMQQKREKLGRDLTEAEEQAQVRRAGHVLQARMAKRPRQTGSDWL